MAGFCVCVHVHACWCVHLCARVLEVGVRENTGRTLKGKSVCLSVISVIYLPLHSAGSLFSRSCSQAN